MLDIKNLLTQLDKIETMEDLLSFQKDVLGKKGKLNEAFKGMKDLDAETRKIRGQELSELKNRLSTAYNEKEMKLSLREINKKLDKDLVDISIDTYHPDQGHFSLLTKTRREIEDICKSLGFIIEYGDEVVSKFENFESVNIPLTHPATEMHDTIYLEDTDPNGEGLVLRTHTSSSQNYLIKKYGAPLKAVIPAKVYRYEDLDATHDSMFYQLEGIFIDKKMSIAQFKNIMTKLLSAILQSDVEIRMRPGYFPFVEPGFEIDAKYDIFDPKTGKTSKSDWVEIVGAGIIHPNVLKEANLDPKIWRGFAFGIGINRIVAIKYGIKDIRYFTNGDLRFVKSFS